MPRKKLYPAGIAIILASSDSVAALARRFGVDRRTIRKVRDGETWASLQPAPSHTED